MKKGSDLFPLRPLCFSFSFLSCLQRRFLWPFLPPRTAASRRRRASPFRSGCTTVRRATSATWVVPWQETPDHMLPGTEITSALTPTPTITLLTHVGCAQWWSSKSGQRTAGITLSSLKTIWGEWSVQLNLLSKVKPHDRVVTINLWSAFNYSFFVSTFRLGWCRVRAPNQ